MNQREVVPQRESVLLRVCHVADHYRRYPGEKVTFYTLVEVGRTLTDFSLRVTVPAGLVLESHGSLEPPAGPPPVIAWDGGVNHLIWKVEREPGSAARYEYKIEATVAPTQEDRKLESRAMVTADWAGEEPIRDVETVSVAIAAKGRYLNHLPALYQEDELMGRFLMLFESFWQPIEHQIADLSLYFDPDMTPPEFLPWLASWLNLVLDEGWPEQKRRNLLRAASSLYRKRGTRQGLQQYLEIFTEGQVRIQEHRAHNFRLGQDARLGPGVALGTGNIPHTFTVTLRVPPVMPTTGEEDETRLELARRRKIEAIIESEKPAHTAYNLHLEIDPDLRMREAR